MAGLALGSVSIPLSSVFDYILNKPISDSHEAILSQIRMPRNLTAILSGAGLSLSGLLLQTLFRNPLAGPSVLGISSGSSLGVAFVLLAGGSMTGFIGTGSVVIGAVIGALIVVLLISMISLKFEDVTLVLIAGLMLGFLSSSLVSILAFFSESEQLKPFIHWGFGSFARLNEYQIPTLVILLFFGVLGTLYLYKPLNALLPGEQFAGSIGINVRKSRITIILLTGLLTGIITAFVGPVGFIGLAVPQVVKLIFNKADDKLLGAHIVGHGATDLISELVVSMETGVTSHQLLKSIHPHPTVSEAIMEAAAVVNNEAIHL